MIKRNAAKPVRVAPPMMEEQEVSTSTLQELLEKEETKFWHYSPRMLVEMLFLEKETSLTRVSRTALSGIRHSANVNSVLLSWQIYGLRTATCPIYLLQKAPFTG